SAAVVVGAVRERAGAGSAGTVANVFAAGSATADSPAPFAACSATGSVVFAGVGSVASRAAAWVASVDRSRNQGAVCAAHSTSTGGTECSTIPDRSRAAQDCQVFITSVALNANHLVRLAHTPAST